VVTCLRCGRILTRRRHRDLQTDKNRLKQVSVGGTTFIWIWMSHGQQSGFSSCNEFFYLVEVLQIFVVLEMPPYLLNLEGGSVLR